jgi:DNA-directed RNA polymerase subunit F
MNKQEMTDTVIADLIHIATGPDEQTELRMIYNSRRRKDLVIGKSRKETIEYCIEVIKKINPNWQPEFDKTYFD